MSHKLLNNEEDRRALTAYLKLVRASETINARMSAQLTQHKITLSQFACLEALYLNGALYQRELARKTFRSGGNITLVLDNLERRNLVIRQRDERDRRFTNVALTDDGHNLLESMFPEYLQEVRRQMDVLDSEQQAQLANICLKLGPTDKS